MTTKNFYSNVFLTGDKIFYIGYDHGERVQYEEVFSPVLFAPTNKKTEYKTLEGGYAQKIDFGSIKDAREFIDQYKDVDNFRSMATTSFLSIH